MGRAAGWTSAGTRANGVEPAAGFAAFEPTSDRPFEAIGPGNAFVGQYLEREIGEALVIDMRAAPLSLRDRASFKPGAGPLAMIHAVVDGRPVYHTRCGAAAPLRPGCLVIRRADDGAEICADHYARVVTVAVAQYLLVPRYATTEALAGHVIEPDGAFAQRLLYSFIVELIDSRNGGGLDGRNTIIDALGGLVSMVAAQIPHPATGLSALAAARADEILLFLQRNFANPHLTPLIMADDLHISVRYAHKVMQLTGRSFRQELIRLRLEAARLAFAAKRRPKQTIADIAISVGFNDLSQFNRHFRVAYAITPTAARRLDEVKGYDAPSETAAKPAGGARSAMMVGAPPGPL